MKEVDIQIGSKVIPFQKTAKGWEEDINEYKNHTYDCGKFFKENGYLYVIEYDGYEQAWILGEDMKDGDYFNAEDFEPYYENINEDYEQQIIHNAVNLLKSKGVTPEMYEEF